MGHVFALVLLYQLFIKGMCASKKKKKSVMKMRVHKNHCCYMLLYAYVLDVTFSYSDIALAVITNLCLKMCDYNN